MYINDMSTYVYLYMYVYTYLYANVHVHVYTDVYTYVYTSGCFQQSVYCKVKCLSKPES